jgi:hypothetical protein
MPESKLVKKMSGLELLREAHLSASEIAIAFASHSERCTSVENFSNLYSRLFDEVINKHKEYVEEFIEEEE